mgnify:CR=1 FL=1
MVSRDSVSGALTPSHKGSKRTISIAAGVPENVAPPTPTTGELITSQNRLLRIAEHALFDAAGVKPTKVTARLTTGAMEKFLRKLGVTGAQYGRWGHQSLGGFIHANRSFRLRDWQVLVLENIERVRAS